VRIAHLHSNQSNELNTYFGNYTIYRQGEKHELRNYKLIPIKLHELALKFDIKQKPHPPKLKYLLEEESIASIYANRNILFGATATKNYYDTCGVLLDEAKIDADATGEQPKAFAALHGLCNWVNDYVFRNKDEHCGIVQNILSNKELHDSIHSIVTGKSIVSPSYSSSGSNSNMNEEVYQIAKDTWVTLANKYCNTKHAEEVILYKSRGAHVVKIEYLADKSTDYLREAGGSMAHMYFY